MTLRSPLRSHVTTVVCVCTSLFKQSIRYQERKRFFYFYYFFFSLLFFNRSVTNHHGLVFIVRVNFRCRLISSARWRAHTINLPNPFVTLYEPFFIFIYFVSLSIRLKFLKKSSAEKNYSSARHSHPAINVTTFFFYERDPILSKNQIGTEIVVTLRYLRLRLP